MTTSDNGLQPSRVAYTNYGIFDKPIAIDLFETVLDTWYYFDNRGVPHEEVGALRLGQGPVMVASGVIPFLAERLARLEHAYSSLLRLEGVVLLGCREPYPSVQGHLASVPRTQLTEGMGMDDAWLIRSASVPVDVALIVRTHEGTLEERWLENVGSIELWASLGDPEAILTTENAQVPWTARLFLEVASIFQAHNEQELTQVRAAWQRWLKEHPTDTWMEGSGSEDACMVTLVEPPKNSPMDNEVLAAANLPRLRQAIGRWEAAEGTSFVWNALRYPFS